MKEANFAWGISYALAVGVLVLATFAVPGARSLALGKDGRTSTSKLQVLLWTYAVLFALFVLLFGYLISQLADAGNWNAADKLSASLGNAFSDFTDKGLDETYLLLLGLPLSAAVTAKAVTTTKVANGTIVKPDKSDEQTSRLQEVVSDDDGSVDLGDFQYFLFALLAVLYFLSQFLAHPARGLPDMPDTLVGLTGVAAAAYIAKKGVYREPPILYSIMPATAAPGDRIEVFGARLLGAPQKGAPDGGQGSTRILFGQTPASPVADPAPSTERLTVEVPQHLEVGPTKVRVERPPGAKSEDLPFEIKDARPLISAVRPSRLLLGIDTEIEIDGVDFFTEAESEKTDKNGVTLDGRRLEPDEWERGRVVAPLPHTDAQLRKVGLKPGEVDLVVYDSAGHASAPQRLRIEASP